MMKPLAALFLVSFVMAGCNRYEDKIVGTWKMDYWMVYSHQGTNGDAVDNRYFTFNKGGKGFETTTNGHGGDVITEFSYSVDGDELRMSLHDFEHNTIEKLDDGKMLLLQQTASSTTEFGFTKSSIGR